MRQFHAKAQRRRGSFWKIGLICVAMVLLAGPSGFMQKFSTPVVSLRHYEIKPDSLPPPNLGPDADNPPRGVPKPADAALHLPAGFEVNVFAEGDFKFVRWLALAPNGDV